MAKWYSTGLLLVATIGYLYYCGSPPSVADASAPAHESSCPVAAELYEVNCSACHGIRGEGVNAAIPPLVGERAAELDMETMMRKVKEGSAGHEPGIGMPPFQGKLSDQMIACLVEYVGNGMKEAL